MKLFKRHLITAAISLFAVASCSYQQNEQETPAKTVIVADLLITNGTVYTGESNQSQSLDIAVCVFVSQS